jgi:hypothetical protein
MRSSTSPVFERLWIGALAFCGSRCDRSGRARSFDAPMQWLARSGLRHAIHRPGMAEPSQGGFMRRTRIGLFAAAMAALVVAGMPLASGSAHAEGASPIYGVTIPKGYRQWQMIAPAEEAAPLDELRVVLGNPLAIKAVQAATLPFPDGTILVYRVRAGVRSRRRYDGASHGQGLEKIRRHGRLGVRPVHQRTAGRRGAAQNLLCLPSGACEESRFRLYAARALIGCHGVRLQCHTDAASVSQLRCSTFSRGMRQPAAPLNMRARLKSL